MSSVQDSCAKNKRESSPSKAFSGKARTRLANEIRQKLHGHWHDVFTKLGVVPADSLPSGDDGYYACRSPIRNEENPDELASFGYSNVHGGYRDHGTGETGDVFKLIQSVLGLSFDEVLRKLAPIAGVDVKVGTSADNGQTGLTPEEYAAAKRLDPDYLASHFAVVQSDYRGKPAVRIPYVDNEGRHIVDRIRIALSGPDRFRWPKGTRAKELVYGLDVIKCFSMPELFVAEGESNLHAAHFHGLQMLTIPGKGFGLERLAKEIAEIPVIEIVTILLDPDAKSLATDVASALRQVGWKGRVRAVVLQKVVGVKDICDLHVKHADDLVAFNEAVARIYEAATDVEGPSGANALPAIMITARSLPAISADALNALLASNDPPQLFQQGNQLIRVRASSEREVILEGHDLWSFRGLMARVGEWTKLDKDGCPVPCFPLTGAVHDILSLPSWPFPVINGVVTAPVLGRDGKLCLEPGYNPSALCWYEPTHTALPAIPERPTLEDVARAKTLLLTELLGEFPLVDAASRATAVAAMLLLFVRPAIEGPTPLHLIDSPSPGTGKGLLADAICAPALGKPASVMAECRDVDEWRKRLTALFVGGPSAILIDNINRKLDSSALAAALTTTIWVDRQLGHTKMLHLPVRCLWLATANNGDLSHEIMRRTILCRLDAKVDRPWQRTKFKHPNLRRWAKEHRAELIGAALTLVQAWIAAHRPKGSQELGSFEEWAQTIGGILEVVKIPGFLENVNTLYERVDDETAEWRAFVNSWWTKLHGTEVTVSRLVKEVLNADPMLLATALASAPSPQGRAVKLGQDLKQRRDSVIGSYRIVAGKTDGHGTQIYLLVLANGESAGNRHGIGGGIGIGNSCTDKDFDQSADPADPFATPAEVAVLGDRSGDFLSVRTDDGKESAESAKSRKYLYEQQVSTADSSADSPPIPQTTKEDRRATAGGNELEW